ncbi:cytokine-like protein 1 isoform X1 [Macaca fascicularis]|uniref:Uncharacterized protein n=1 Tax=Macaca fascicularis TaxID=9541 RepID=A0A7N9CCB2_MACFA|nr:PREDICTED: cytokine-like protein 1 isoform X1 [Macaca fascicularis]
MRTPGPLPVLLLLLAGIPAARPTPPTCYSRMRALSQEITRDFQLLQSSEPSNSWKMYKVQRRKSILLVILPARGSCCCSVLEDHISAFCLHIGAVCEIPAQAVPGHTQLLCAGQAAGLCGLAPVLESGPGGFLEGQSTEVVHHHELVLQEGLGLPVR